jgi:hypothetical protein
MQLVEQGRIDLHADVTQYLTEFQVPDTFPEAITMHHLLTHTAGFDDRFYTLGIAPGPDEIDPLGEHLREHLPPRIRPPGEVNQYSNAGMALAGHIVETVTGEAFHDYVTAHVLEPLGMTQSAYGLPTDLLPDMAFGHENFPEESFAPQDSWHIHERPTAGIRAAANDVAAFMIAHLNGGEYDGARILEPETIELMHETHFRPHPGVSGSAYGFIEHLVGDRRGIHHGGQWIGFSNLLYLLPEENAGMLVSYNNGAGIFAQTELFEAVLEQFFPVELDDPEAASGAAERAEAVAGTYRWNRVDRHTFMSLPSVLTGQTIDVTAQSDGTITVSMSPALIPDATWVEVEPGVYREQGGTNRLAFDLDNGSASTAYLSWPLLMTMDRIAWHQSVGLHLGVLVLTLIVLLSTVVWPVRRLYRRVRGRQWQTPLPLHYARITGGTIAALFFVFLLGTLAMAASDPVGFFQVPTGFKVLLVLPIVAAVLTPPFLALVTRLWLQPAGTLASRIHLTIVALALVVFIPWLYYWQLLGFNY